MDCEGRRGFEFASINLKEGKQFFAQICFHFQQSAEKYLKSFIVMVYWIDRNVAAPRRFRESMQRKVRQLIKYLLPYGPDRLYLFGSWAREEQDELSDLDLVIIKETETPFFERLQEVARLLPAEIGGVDILVYTPEEFDAMKCDGNAFAEMIVEEGRLIYENEAKD